MRKSFYSVFSVIISMFCETERTGITLINLFTFATI